MIGDILQPTHLLFILAVALLVLGPKRLPEVGRSLGKSMNAFRGAMAGIEEQTKDVFNFEEPQTAGSSTTDQVVTATAVQPEETVLVNTATVPVAAPAAQSVGTTATVEPDPADYAD